MILTLHDVANRLDKLEALVRKMLECQTKTAAILDEHFKFIGEELERINQKLKTEEGIAIEGGKLEDAE